ncbi:MFS transporter [Paenibacillus sp. GSMTC-2017]|uniref:CynX/NimT family MFS transporter n=1 Tax=Paenibacillus sp. GSMTC-2017 TaxID=2794350 RepID=UPI0018D63697|nr:MFS transporter [Paenibacillus sp. GSMTC-2017]MBH5318171.1 MFS transporter [Paenibacillus sp. GSMTC-2017]
MNSESQSAGNQKGAPLSLVSDNSNNRTWLLVLSIILVALIMRAPITSVGPIVDKISTSMGLSGGMTGLLTTLPLLAFAFVSPFAPKIAARIGMEFSLFAASLLLTAAIIVRSLPSVYALFLGTALLGTAIAVANVLIPSLVKREYPNKIGLMTGIYTVAMNLGAAVGSGISVPLTDGFGVSWQVTLAVTSVVALVAAIVWLPLISKNGIINTSVRVQTSAVQKGTKSNKSVWNSPLAWSVSLFLGLQSFCFYVNVTWTPLILVDKGLDQASAGWMLSLMQLVSMLSTFIIPIMAGKRTSQRSIALLISSLFVCGYLLLLLGGSVVVPLSMVILGLGVGGGFGLAVMFFALRTRTSEESAQLSGMAQSIGYLLAASGPFLFGLLYDWTDTWGIPLLLIIAVSIMYGIIGLYAGSDRKI